MATNGVVVLYPSALRISAFHGSPPFESPGYKSQQLRVNQSPVRQHSALVQVINFRDI